MAKLKETLPKQVQFVWSEVSQGRNQGSQFFVAGVAPSQSVHEGYKAATLP